MLYGFLGKMPFVTCKTEMDGNKGTKRKVTTDPLFVDMADHDPQCEAEACLSTSGNIRCRYPKENPALSVMRPVSQNKNMRMLVSPPLRPRVSWLGDAPNHAKGNRKCIIALNAESDPTW